ncbi:MAG TPA: peptidase M17 [Bacteroidales bacterium]|nr:MAG: hypothetical protein A2X11_14675 [Bacteroidetes bacterium GWE2_42_24]OFY31594.1 MAG: hypothetical protein A2X09_08415 [Bacteroidetes bacterium GWF2_43_11]HAQ64400.1 peptidase M17 [Bacteroidales bacterium]HBZ67150.1 peptidase M17 [Bacteroidales bacterium]
MIHLKKELQSPPPSTANIYILNEWEPSQLSFSNDVIQFIASKSETKSDEFIEVINLDQYTAIYFCSKDTDASRRIEKCRKAGDKLQQKSLELKIKNTIIHSVDLLKDETLAFAEGIMLGAYQFFPFKTDKIKKQHTLETIILQNAAIGQMEIDRLTNTVKSVYQCRDLVNLPVNHLNTIKLAEKLTEMANLCKIRIEVLNKKQIESLRMGGLLSVNLGSVDPPVFIIMEFKPKRAVNKQPLVLIGKGITYDTGGLNLKTGNFMDDMKLDMGGAAAVATTLQTIALNNIPLHTIVLIPATDNRPDGNAMASGDVITMYDGTTVEVLNTDAEGRLILADALAWAKQYNPMLVVDMATLTGAAARAIGSHGIVSMHQRAAQFMEFMKLAGEQTGERIAEFPFWEEYDEQINSEIADLKNIGGPEGGAITAGKFLAHFTDYPYIHMDIAGPVFLNKRDSYRGSGATGVGVRILSRMAELLAQ